MVYVSDASQVSDWIHISTKSHWCQIFINMYIYIWIFSEHRQQSQSCCLSFFLIHYEYVLCTGSSMCRIQLPPLPCLSISIGSWISSTFLTNSSSSHKSLHAPVPQYLSNPLHLRTSSQTLCSSDTGPLSIPTEDFRWHPQWGRAHSLEILKWIVRW